MDTVDLDTLRQSGICNSRSCRLKHRSWMLTHMQVRIFYRLIEFSAGKDSSNPLPYHEAYFYALEAVPMFCAIAVFNITHPSSIMKGPDARLPGIRSLMRRGFKQIDGEGGEELLVSKPPPSPRVGQRIRQ